MGVKTYPVPARQFVDCHPPAGGEEPSRGVLGVDPTLDRVPLDLDVVLLNIELVPSCDLYLFLNQVDPGDDLAHRVLDLYTGVHLDEVKIILVIKDELHRPRILIANCTCCIEGGIMKVSSHLLIEVRSW